MTNLSSGIIIVVSILVVVVGLGTTSASASNHGFCHSYDYNDDGDKYCDDFETVEEMRQTHIQLRKFCKSMKKGNRCEAVLYFKVGEKYFYEQIKYCFYYEERNKSRFMHLNSAEKVAAPMWQINIIEEITHGGSCHDNREIFQDFPYPRGPYFVVVEDGVVKWDNVKRMNN